MAETSDDKLHRFKKGLLLFTQNVSVVNTATVRDSDTTVTIIRNLYKGSRSCVKLNGVCGDWFEVVAGLRQGCIL